MSESALVRKMIAAIKKRWPLAYIRKLADRHSRGIPDILAIIGGKTTFIEVKLPEEQPRPIQLAEHNAIRVAGGDVIVSDDAQQAVKYLEVKHGIVA